MLGVGSGCRFGVLGCRRECYQYLDAFAAFAAELDKLAGFVAAVAA